MGFVHDKGQHFRDAVREGNTCFDVLLLIIEVLDVDDLEDCRARFFNAVKVLNDVLDTMLGQMSDHLHFPVLLF